MHQTQEQVHSVALAEGLEDLSPYVGGKDLSGATVLFTSTTQVVVPTDHEMDATGLLVADTFVDTLVC